jgi:hypothetical protein
MRLGYPMGVLSGKVWWPLFPLLLLIVVLALSAAVVWTIRKKAAKADILVQMLALFCYVFTAVVAVASEGGSVSPNVHRLPSLLTQAVLLAQLTRIWKREGTRPLRTLNIIAWGAILADTALHYLIKAEH